MSRTVEGWLVAMVVFQTVFILLHDWVPLGRLSNLQAVRGIDSTAKLLWTTLLSVLPWVIALGLCVKFWPVWPHGVATYLWVLEGVAAVGASMAWWIPYLVKPDPERAARYKVRFAGTVRFLPERNGISPDLLHVVLHTTIVAALVLLAVL